MIKWLANDNGDIIEGNVDLENLIGGFSGGLFTYDTGDPDQDLLNKVKKVLRDMNETLLALFSQRS
jgi:hypothetical protein